MNLSTNPIYIVAVHNNEIVVRWKSNESKKQHYRSVGSIEEYKTFLHEQARSMGVEPNNLTVLVSSSMNWPEEYTDNPDVLKLCEQIHELKMEDI